MTENVTFEEIYEHIYKNGLRLSIKYKNKIYECTIKNPHKVNPVQSSAKDKILTNSITRAVREMINSAKTPVRLRIGDSVTITSENSKHNGIVKNITDDSIDIQYGDLFNNKIIKISRCNQYE